MLGTQLVGVGDVHGAVKQDEFICCRLMRDKCAGSGWYVTKAQLQRGKSILAAVISCYLIHLYCLFKVQTDPCTV